ncbi:MAG: hypothetical protein GYA24_24420 [Candidatus Lokiarchaeota archaeon]|nr:hypothetical protein [Candidatus Lokiarchaeota archaeon]
MPCEHEHDARDADVDDDDEVDNDEDDGEHPADFFEEQDARWEDVLIETAIEQEAKEAPNKP